MVLITADMLRFQVVQEAALAPLSVCTYVCGGENNQNQIPLLDILRAASWLVAHVDYLPESLRSSVRLTNADRMWDYIDKEAGYFAAHKHRPSLLSLICALQDFECSEPRDHVNGLLGLYKHFSAPGTNLLRPDYTSALSSIFRDATRAIINENRSLRVLREVHPRDHDLEDIPSWVPRWDRRWDRNYDPARLSYHHYRSCGSKRQVMFHADAGLDDTNVLSVLGMLCSSVAMVGSPQLVWGDASNEALELCASIERAHRDGGYNVADLHEELAMGMVRGTDQLLLPISPVAAMRKFAIWKKYLSDNQHWPPQLRQFSNGRGHDGEELIAAEYNEAFFDACLKRAVFIASNGHIGLGPKTIAHSDVIAILWGCEWPVALRPLQQRGEYKFLGVCYVYGIMQGEAVQADEEGNVEGEQVFHIR